MRISDWSSDVCSSDLSEACRNHAHLERKVNPPAQKIGHFVMDDTLPEGKVSSMTVCGSLRRQSVSPRNGSLAQTLYGRSSIGAGAFAAITTQALSTDRADRKSTRLNSSH